MLTDLLGRQLGLNYKLIYLLNLGVGLKPPNTYGEEEEEDTSLRKWLNYFVSDINFKNTRLHCTVVNSLTLFQG